MIKKYFLAFIFLFSSLNINAQQALDSLDLSKTFLIGVTTTPPFVMQENGEYTGLSIDSWELVNEGLDLDYEYKEYATLKALLNGIENREVDFSINPVTVTNSRMQRMDFSQPYFISHTGVAKRSESQIFNYLGNLFSWNFISAILILLAVIFIFGFLVWIFERKKNVEEFGGGSRGILQGFWWSAVTMTTVGYGDKSPKTIGGRVIALVWMFMAIIIISSLTAGIASSLTVQSMNDEINSVQDLSKFDVSSVESSSAQELLDLYNIDHTTVLDEKEGIDLLENREIKLFVYDEPILRYEIKQSGLEGEIEILPKTLKMDYYGYSFPRNSPLLKKIDPVLIGVMKTMEWNSIMSEYE
ncbi:amino acid ABC transporter substrate-binding protein (PAAT family) [Salegentibacter sp. 24]|jgi:ABC-type amino acid transport substrate-binding protein|uniref:transporter substrate-binding domain-containing protein n=1 Tax=Salegentibacter sp. 24 TaxID=2183986 RepID=UPI00105E2E26|nr:transporter substrate-binding domain-containing protein [Salegentibacter sp. 24]TDN85896.1 amino acid ABC transporter substrate-binding protein (PAAT family) [Salegentibacter sp. 24]